jgi:hypothetical protein
MMWTTAGAVFSNFNYKDALGSGVENKALNLSENIELGTRNEQWRRREGMLND